MNVEYLIVHNGHRHKHHPSPNAWPKQTWPFTMVLHLGNFTNVFKVETLKLEYESIILWNFSRRFQYRLPHQSVLIVCCDIIRSFFILVCHEHQFKDRYLFYRFAEDERIADRRGGGGENNRDTRDRGYVSDCEEELSDVLCLLAQIAPDAMMRMILRKV